MPTDLLPLLGLQNRINPVRLLLVVVEHQLVLVIVVALRGEEVDAGLTGTSRGHKNGFLLLAGARYFGNPEQQNKVLLFYNTSSFFQFLFEAN